MRASVRKAERAVHPVWVVLPMHVQIDIYDTKKVDDIDRCRELIFRHPTKRPYLL
jgi:hypothetical protein